MKKVFSLCAALLLAVSLMNVPVFAAADPIVMDFSTDPDAFQGISADGNWSYVNDGDKRVLFEECINGADPNDATSATGDVYGSVLFDPTIDAATYKWLKIGLKNESPYTTFEFHYGGDMHGIAAEACTHFPISANDTDYKTYVINIPESTIATYPVHPAIDFTNVSVFWEGKINEFRMDFAYDVEPGGRVAEGTKMYVEYIAFFDSKEAADAWTYTPAGGPVEETTAAATTEAPAATAAVTETPAATNDGSAAATDGSAAATTAAAEDGSSSSTGIIIGGVAAAVVVIIIIAAVVSSKKKKK